MLRDLLELVPYLLLFLIVRAAVRGFLADRRRARPVRPASPAHLAPTSAAGGRRKTAARPLGSSAPRRGRSR